jgi:hypothetical protein
MGEEIFRISKDYERAKDLFQISKERIDLIKFIPKDRPFKILEDYYEIILGLLTATMYIDGYKTLSHVSLIDYFSQNYRVLSDNQIKIIDTMRKFRHGIVYYGKKIKEEYFVNTEEEINKIITILSKLVEEKLKKSY